MRELLYTLASLCVRDLLLYCGCCSPTSLLHQLAHHPCSYRGHLTGFCHHCVARSDCGCNLPGQQVQGEIPGADQTSYPQQQYHLKTHKEKT